MAARSAGKGSAGQGSRKALIAVVAAAALIGIAAYAYVLYGSLPAALASTLSSGRQPNSTALQGMLLQKIDSAKTFSVGYSGQITINRDPPIGFSFAKYYNDTRISFFFEDMPTFGNLSAVVISRNFGENGTLCIRADPGSALAIRNGSSAGNGYSCLQTGSSGAGAQLFGIADRLVNVSSLSGISTHSYGVTLYGGQPCYSVSGSGTIMVNSTLVDVKSSAQAPVSVGFSACFSAQYNIPLTIDANLTAGNGSSIRILLNESTIGEAASAEEVDALP